MQLLDLDSIVRKQIEEAMDKQVKPALVKSHERVVADWKHKPKFGAQKRIRPERITVSVFPTGDNAKIYNFVDKGTEPHEIRPVRAKALRFNTGYQPKTLARPARTVSGGGKATGPEVFAQVVHHPGSEAREFSKTIAEDISPHFKRLIENAFRKAARQTEE